MSLITELNYIKQPTEQELARREQLHVSELFYSIQGEGPSMGVPCYFIRLSGCNLECGGRGSTKSGLLHDNATWRCDSMEVWTKGTKMSYQEILDKLRGRENVFANIAGGAHIVITGGEPLLQQKKIVAFLQELHADYNAWLTDNMAWMWAKDVYVEVETNGTVLPIPELLLSELELNGRPANIIVSQWNVSPKLQNSGMPKAARISRGPLQTLVAAKAYFKFVIEDEHDFFEVCSDYIEPYQIPSVSTYLMPAADNDSDLTRVSQVVAQIAMDNALRFSSRLHIHIWNQATGV